MHSGSGLVHTLPKMDHLRPSIALLLQLGVPVDKDLSDGIVEPESVAVVGPNIFGCPWSGLLTQRLKL